MNVLDRQITLDGPRNLVVKWTGVLDNSDISETPALALGDCINNSSIQTLVGFRVDMLEYSIGNGIEVQLQWNSAFPQQIYNLAGRGKIFSSSYGGFLPDSTRVGYDGNINLITTGFDPNTVQNFTLVLEFVKLYRHENG